MFKGEPKKPTKVGKMTTVDMETGKVVAENRNAMTMLPPSPDVCQTCATDHPLDAPHNQQSIFYQMAFHATHGRFPTWTDSMQHCTPKVQKMWRKTLIEYLNKNKMPIPDDLADPKPGGR